MKKEDILKAVQDNPDYVMITLSGYYENTASTFTVNQDFEAAFIGAAYRPKPDYSQHNRDGYYFVKLTTEEFTDDIVHCLKNLDKISDRSIKNSWLTDEMYTFLNKFNINNTVKILCLQAIDFYDASVDKVYKLDIDKLYHNTINKVETFFTNDELKKSKYYDDLNLLIKNYYVFNNDFVLSIDFLKNLSVKGSIIYENSVDVHKVIYKLIIDNKYELNNTFSKRGKWEGLTIKKNK